MSIVLSWKTWIQYCYSKINCYVTKPRSKYVNKSTSVKNQTIELTVSLENSDQCLKEWAWMTKLWLGWRVWVVLMCALTMELGGIFWRASRRQLKGTEGWGWDTKEDKGLKRQRPLNLFCLSEDNVSSSSEFYSRKISLSEGDLFFCYKPRILFLF